MSIIPRLCFLLAQLGCSHVLDGAIGKATVGAILGGVDTVVDVQLSALVAREIVHIGGAAAA